MRPILILAIGGMTVGSLASLGAPRAAEPGPSYGFVVTNLSPAFYKGPEALDCPDGRSHTVKEAFLATLSPAERTRLQKPENVAEFEQGYKVRYVYRGDGKDICTHAAAFDTPDRNTQKILKGPLAFGLNLDGEDSKGAPAGGCAHDNFKSPSGETGVDNQYFRAIGCNTFWRGAGEGVGDDVELHRRKWADNAAVLIVRGVDSWADDDSVEVEISASVTPSATDSSRRLLSGASYVVTPNARWRTTFTGRISKGLLIADPSDMILPMNWVGGSGGEYILKHLRFRVKRLPDGNLDGVGGAYRPIDNALAIQQVGGEGVASTAGVECASVRKTFKLLADGDRDPKTGQCTTVSTGLDVTATPAFVFDGHRLIGSPDGSQALPTRP